MFRKFFRKDKTKNNNATISQTDKTAEEYKKEGDAKFEMKEYKEAIVLYGKAIKQDDKNYLYYRLRARCFYFLTNYQEAIEDYKQAIKLNPTNYHIYNDLGYTFRMSNNQDMAIENYTKAIQIKPNQDSYFNRGMSFYLQGKFNEAVNDFNEVIKLEPESDLCYLLRGNCFCKQAEFAKALNDYYQAVSLGSSNSNLTDNINCANKGLEILKTLSATDDIETRTTLVKEIKFCNENVLLKRAAKLNELGKRGLNFVQAQTYLANGANLWLLQGKTLPQFKYMEDPNLLISANVLGVSCQDTKKIINTLCERIYSGAAEICLSKLKSGLFSVEKYKENSDKVYENYQRRKFN